MKLNPAQLFVFLIFASAASPAPTPAVSLTVRPIHSVTGYEAIEVALGFRGEADGETIVRLPGEWGGESRLYEAIRAMHASGAEIAESGAAATRILRHRPNADIVLTYQVMGARIAAEPGRGNDYRVRAERDFFFALGETIVPRPGNIPTSAPARFEIVGLPNGATFASDLEHRTRGLRFADLVESVILGGDVRVIDAGGGARLAIHGAVDSRDDAGWRDAFVRIASAQRAYWRANDEPYLVTILAMAPENESSVSVGGTGRTDAFAFFATSNAPAETLDQVMSHEMMHTWVPRRIGRLREEPSEAQDYWLSEGFTDWASMRVLTRSGQWSAAEFVARFNEFLREYDQSSVREAPNARIVADFWNDAEVGDLPYRRGMLLATYWDARVRAATDGRKNFDDVLLWMQARARREPAAPAVDLLRRAMRRIARIDIAPELTAYVEEGRAVELPGDIFELCGALEWIERPPFHRGFDIEATMEGDGIIRGTIVDGPAWRAGLRDGMRLIGRRGGEIGDPDQEIAYEIEDQQGRRILRWMPQGQGAERFRRLTLRNDPGPGCLRRLGGT